MKEVRIRIAANRKTLRRSSVIDYLHAIGAAVDIDTLVIVSAVGARGGAIIGFVVKEVVHEIINTDTCERICACLIDIYGKIDRA